jgi:16S rRNA processing protein RimM
VLVGVVVGVFGLRGELKVRPETDFPERFARTARVYVGPERAPMRVRGARLVPGQVILRLEGIGDAGAAERLRGAPLYVPTAEAAPLAPDQFYLHDVIGLRAERPDGSELGTVADVYTGTGQDVFVVRAAGTGREVLVPAVKEMVKRVDVAAGVVVIDPIPGLFDEGFAVADPTEPAE